MLRFTALFLLMVAPALPAAAQPSDAGQQVLQTYTVAYGYDAAGRLTEVDYGLIGRIRYAYDPSGTLTERVAENTGTTAVDDEGGVPARFALHDGYPNPFNPTAVIPFDVKARVRVVLTVYDVLGRRVATLVDRDYLPGRYTADFEARGLPSGLYVYRITMGDFADTKTVLLIK